MKSHRPKSQFTFPQQDRSVLQYDQVPVFAAKNPANSQTKLTKGLTSPRQDFRSERSPIDSSLSLGPDALNFGELDLLLEGAAQTRESASVSFEISKDSNFTRAWSVRPSEEPLSGKLQATYHAYCLERQGLKRRKVCPYDPVIERQTEQQEQSERNSWSSLELHPLWTQTVKQHIDRLAQHFQHSAISKKSAWAAKQVQPHESPRSEILPQIADISDPDIPSPEVGRALNWDNSEELHPDYPWSRLGETRIGASTPRRHSDHRRSDSFSDVLRASSYAMPSPDWLNSLPDALRSRDSFNISQRTSPSLTSRGSLIPGLLDESLAEAQFDISSESAVAERAPKQSSPQNNSTIEPETQDFLVYLRLVCHSSTSRQVNMDELVPRTDPARNAANALWHLLVLSSCGMCRLHQEASYEPIQIRLP
ncbi:hypothetical protein MPSI1_003646 [Malassezia psittaci]|uniref:Rad21/Rec8-like protein C-terminal eukaryotic domain-containing protein n=1 Tax=Malassezia psittaci TaxID=1821823 RepID=A0AAF0JFQ1_9BASI|nr:hypothetical protein MPSI1_003646 [Malassezia psittaci]